MNILLVGFGFYVLGNENCIGGTIMPAILKWKNTIGQENILITCLVKSKSSKINAKKRFLNFKNRYKDLTKIQVQIKEYHELKVGQNFDCAIIAIPEKSHLECLNLIIDRTNQIICVKPFTQNKNEFIKALELSKQKNANIFIDFHKRFDPANIEFIRNASAHSHTSGLFTFSYGQKMEMPFKYFQKWAESSNPFQYLAPHYLDIIFEILRKSGVNLNNLKINGSVNFLTFSKKPNLISIISCNLELFNEKYSYLINSMCNWMEPKTTPFNSRQRIEFQTESLHLISEQDNRGQSIIKDDLFKSPNPHFMTSDNLSNFSGYGVDSFYNFLEYVSKRFPKENLISINDYGIIAEIIDYINLLIKK